MPWNRYLNVTSHACYVTDVCIQACLIKKQTAKTNNNNNINIYKIYKIDTIYKPIILYKHKQHIYKTINTSIST